MKPLALSPRYIYKIGRLLLSLLVTGAAAAVAESPRNVILFIGDGMGDQQITIARNYLAGAQGKLLLDELPFRAAVQVLTVDEQGKPEYVADSANSATSMATGEITMLRRIAMAPDGTTQLPTILQQAAARGLRTGIVSTASVTDATPASFVAHMSLRHCESPSAMLGAKRSWTRLPHCKELLAANGGPGSISEQIAGSDATLVLGGGFKHFEMPVEDGSQSVIELAEDSGFAVVTDLSQLSALDNKQRVLGLFSKGHLPERLVGEAGRRGEAPTPSWANYISEYLGSVLLPEPMNCVANPAAEGAPTMAALTEAALTRLDNEAGFFLMVESASIDKASHQRRACGSIGELEQLIESVQVALDYAVTHTETLILITADHAQAAQLIPDTSYYATYGIPVFSPGKVARVITPEGAVMAVNYATNGFEYQEHTGANVPLFGNQQAVGRIPTLITQPDIYHIMYRYLFDENAE